MTTEDLLPRDVSEDLLKAVDATIRYFQPRVNVPTALMVLTTLVITTCEQSGYSPERFAELLQRMDKSFIDVRAIRRANDVKPH